GRPGCAGGHGPEAAREEGRREAEAERGDLRRRLRRVPAAAVGGPRRPRAVARRHRRQRPRRARGLPQRPRRVRGPHVAGRVAATDPGHARVGAARRVPEGRRRGVAAPRGRDRRRRRRREDVPPRPVAGRGPLRGQGRDGRRPLLLLQILRQRPHLRVGRGVAARRRRRRGHRRRGPRVGLVRVHRARGGFRLGDDPRRRHLRLRRVPAALGGRFGDGLPHEDDPRRPRRRGPRGVDGVGLRRRALDEAGGAALHEQVLQPQQGGRRGRGAPRRGPRERPGRAAHDAHRRGRRLQRLRLRAGPGPGGRNREVDGTRHRGEA
ncbi:expressed protein, partial [Aureococcus anophagefferens]